MKKPFIHLDSILLFLLAIPFIMMVRISPGETPYWLFTLIFIGLLSYIILDILQLKEQLFVKAKLILLWIIIITVIGSAIFSAIVVRHRTHPIYNVHDIVLQQEAAIRYFLIGKNPYKETYFGTPLEQWNYSDKEINPALYHFVMQPLYLLFALPFYFVSNHTIGYFDGRIPLFFLFFILLVAASLLMKDEEKKRQFLVLLAFNPAMLLYTLEGRSDLFMLPFLFISLYFLHKEKLNWSSIFLALAFAVKQSVWPFFPFYLAYLYFLKKDIKKLVTPLAIFFGVFGGIVFPFFFWDPSAFVASTISYLSGNVPHSYPISGYGFGMLLHEWGVIKDFHEYHPFMLWQIVFCLPLFVLLIKYLRKNINIQALILVYTLFLFVYWYFSRYFNNSHLGYLSMLFIMAYFWPDTARKDPK